MKHAAKNRGSALMLVVALLTIVAMLGSTFLIASYLDAQQAQAIAMRGTVPPLNNGVLSQILQIAKLDKYIAEGFGAFGQLSATPEDWVKWVDMPGRDADAWLSEGSNEPGAWRSSVFGNQPRDGEADTNGDEQFDADVYNVRVMNINGDAYYMAVRVVDTSGLICINVAGYPDESIAPFDPAMVDLRGFVGTSAYTALNRARSGTAGSSLTEYIEDCAHRLLSPASGYQPFPFSDEAVLRWRAIGSESERSRLFEILEEEDQLNKMPHMTTISISLSSVRYPGDGEARARILIDDRDALSDMDRLMRLYIYMRGAIGEPDEVEVEALIADDMGATASGVWVQVSDDNAYSGRYLQSEADAAKGGYVKYTFWPAEAGDYVLSVRAPGGAENSAAVPVTVYYVSGGVRASQDLIWNQTANSNRWVSIGLLEDVDVERVLVYVDTQGTEGRIVNADAFMLTPVTGVGSPEAAHFVANMWSFLSYPGNELTGTFNVAPKPSWMAFGVVPQLVISEVYAHMTIQPGVGGGQQWGFAIELFNPTEETLDVSNYIVTSDLNNWSFPGMSVAPGERIVLWSAGVSGGDNPPPPDPASEFGFEVSDSNWYECPPLSAFPSTKIMIQRVTDMAYIPVDSVVAPEIVPVGMWSGTYDAERDDDIVRQRCLVPVYSGAGRQAASETDHSLGQPNELTLAEMDEGNISGISISQVMQGFSITRLPVDVSAPVSIGDFGDCYVVGPDSAGMDLPHKLYPVDEDTGELDETRRAYFDKLSRGRAHIGFTNPEAEAYPDVPWATLLAEFIELVPPDETDHMDPPMVIYGRINPNTASADVLARLPYPETVYWDWIDGDGNQSTLELSVDPDAAAQAIIDYRDTIGRGGYLRFVDPSYDSDGSDGTMSCLRGDVNSAVKGFFTPGEIAIPLAAYTEQMMAAEIGTLSEDDRMQPGFLAARDALYRAVINSITVNSETFAVTTTVLIGNPPRGRPTWYLAIIDRHNCNDPEDSPTVLFVSEINK